MRNEQLLQREWIAQRADEVRNVLAERCPAIAETVYKKLRIIGKVGELAMLRLANDMDLVIAVSILEQYRQDEGDGQEPTKGTANGGDPILEKKLAQFHQCLEKAGYGKGPGRIRFRLRREHLMNDAFEKVLTVSAEQLRKCQMTVTFDYEDGLIYGGPSRELLLSRELFHPWHGLFEFSGPNAHTVQISPTTKFIDKHSKWMELCGRVLGLALVHRCLLDSFFTRSFYKMLAQLFVTVHPMVKLDFCMTKEMAGEMSNADRLRLLQFVTGSSSVPYEGFKALRGSDGPKRFCIERWGTEESLPRAHTCFNRLDLPPYRDKNTLKSKLTLVICESSSYAIE